MPLTHASRAHPADIARRPAETRWNRVQSARSERLLILLEIHRSKIASDVPLAGLLRRKVGTCISASLPRHAVRNSLRTLLMQRRGIPFLSLEDGSKYTHVAYFLIIRVGQILLKNLISSLSGA